jgi:hypothetical protein
MGYPPCMPLYSGWLDCLRQLRAKNQLKRGSSLLFRYYTGPQVAALSLTPGPQRIVGDRVIPLDSSMFRAPRAASG